MQQIAENPGWWHVDMADAISSAYDQIVFKIAFSIMISNGMCVLYCSIISKVLDGEAPVIVIRCMNTIVMK